MSEPQAAAIGTFPRGFSQERPPLWPLVRADSLVELQYGRALTESRRQPGSIPVYGTNGQCGWHDEPLAEGPGVILGRKGMGNLGVEWCGGPFWVIDTAYFANPKTNALDLRFFYYLISYIGLNHLKDGTSNPSLSRDTFAAQLLPFPPLKVQQAIAATHAEIDDKIEQNRRTAQALERLARAIFRAWFVDFEPVKAKAAGATAFPSMPQHVFDALPTTFTDSDIGPVPEGWRVQAIAKIATFLNGLALQKYPPRGDGHDLPVIKIAQLRKGSPEGAYLANDDVPAQYVVNDSDLLFSWSGTLEAEFWFGGKGALNQHLFKVMSSHVPNWLCLLWIRQHLPWFRTIASSKATTMGHIKRSHLQEARVVMPPDDFLRAAEAVIGPLYELYAQTMIELRKLAEMRDYLLPKLLSGEVGVQMDEGGSHEH